MDLKQRFHELKLSEGLKIIEHNLNERMEEMDADENEVSSESRHNGPIVILMIGLAGAGKTTLTQRLTSYIMSIKKIPYLVNLDPACNDPPFPLNIDIRDTLNFKSIKSQYCLGPNGGIVTSLNIFAAKFNDVIEILKQRQSSCDYILIDTPGQIEVFMWSASGQIIMQSLGSLYPTVIAYVTDLKLCTNPITFISNMTYASSIIYKSRLPMVITLNKADQVNPAYAKEWITDFEAFQAAVRNMEGYSANLASSLSLVMDELYSVLEHTSVSAYSGEGIKEFFAAIHNSVDEYELVFRPYFEKLRTKCLKERDKKLKISHLRQNLASRTEQSIFSVPGSSDAGQGLNLRLGDEEDDEDTSSDEDDANDEDDDEIDFRGMMLEESRKRTEKAKGVNPNKEL